MTPDDETLSQVVLDDETLRPAVDATWNLRVGDAPVWVGDDPVPTRKPVYVHELLVPDELEVLLTAARAAIAAPVLARHAPNAAGDCPLCRCSCCDDPEPYPCPTARDLGVQPEASS